MLFFFLYIFFLLNFIYLFYITCSYEDNNYIKNFKWWVIIKSFVCISKNKIFIYYYVIIFIKPKTENVNKTIRLLIPKINSIIIKNVVVFLYLIIIHFKIELVFKIGHLSSTLYLL